jgi:hypothetical protein
MREDIQKHGARQLSRREEWARSVRGVYRRGAFCLTLLDKQFFDGGFLKKKIKPLTEEEKNQKLEELREKMAGKRALKAAEEAKEAKANELIRRKAGKVRLKLNLTPSYKQSIVVWLTYIDRKLRT